LAHQGGLCEKPLGSLALETLHHVVAAGFSCSVVAAGFSLRKSVVQQNDMPFVRDKKDKAVRKYVGVDFQRIRCVASHIHTDPVDEPYGRMEWI